MTTFNIKTLPQRGEMEGAFYPKNIYAIAIAAMIPAKSAKRPQVTA
jgi:hypothetical protein